MSRGPSDESTQLRNLVSDFAALSIEVRCLRERVSDLESQVGVSSARSAGSFSIVDPPPTELPLASEPTQRSAGYCVGAEREQIARDIGRWLRRALDGQIRGPSGRDRLALASRYYVVCRDVNGTSHNPPLLFSTWKAAKESCIRQGEPGDAVFIGLPSKTEIEIALGAAALDLPAALRQQ